MISFDEFLKQDDEEKYNNMQHDLLEIERLNNIIDKKEQFLGDNIKRLEREVVKRDNVINELEKWLKYEINKSGFEQDYERKLCYEDIFDELQELKGSDKE